MISVLRVERLRAMLQGGVMMLCGGVFDILKWLRWNLGRS